MCLEPVSDLDTHTTLVPQQIDRTLLSTKSKYMVSTDREDVSTSEEESHQPQTRAVTRPHIRIIAPTSPPGENVAIYEDRPINSQPQLSV